MPVVGRTVIERLLCTGGEQRPQRTTRHGGYDESTMYVFWRGRNDDGMWVLAVCALASDPVSLSSTPRDCCEYHRCSERHTGGKRRNALWNVLLTRTGHCRRH